jgi:hypothetical protein
MSTKKDYVEVTVKLPREVAEWFSLFSSDLAETLEDEIVQLCQAQIDNSDVLLSPEALTERFQLKPVFQKYGLTH